MLLLLFGHSFSCINFLSSDISGQYRCQATNNINVNRPFYKIFKIDPFCPSIPQKWYLIQNREFSTQAGFFSFSPYSQFFGGPPELQKYNCWGCDQSQILSVLCLCQVFTVHTVVMNTSKLILIYISMRDLQFTYEIASHLKDCTKLDHCFFDEFIFVGENLHREIFSKGKKKKKDQK